MMLMTVGVFTHFWYSYTSYTTLVLCTPLHMYSLQYAIWVYVWSTQDHSCVDINRSGQFVHYVNPACDGYSVNICDPLSENLHNSCKHVYWKKTKFIIMCEITYATGKYLLGLMGPAMSEGSFKSTKTMYHLTHLAMESSKISVLFL